MPYGHGGLLNLRTVAICIKCQPLFDKRLRMELAEIGPEAREEKSFKGVDGRTDGRTTDASDQRSSSF